MATVDQYVTKNDLDNALSGVVTEISGVIADLADRIDTRFNKVETDIIGLKNDVAELKNDVAELNVKYDHLLRTMDDFIAKITHNEAENTARDAEIARLKRWVEILAKESGIKLPIN